MGNEVDLHPHKIRYGLHSSERMEAHPTWSRRIDDEDRLVYRGSKESITITQCKGHYDDK